MEKEGFFRPNLWKIAIFVILIIVSFFVTKNLEISPCKARSVVPNSEFVNGFCSPPLPMLGIAGVQTVYLPIAYILYFVLIL